MWVKHLESRVGLLHAKNNLQVRHQETLVCPCEWLFDLLPFVLCLIELFWWRIYKKRLKIQTRRMSQYSLCKAGMLFN